MSSLSLRQLREELTELQLDREAFSKAYDIMKARIRESANTSRSQPPLFKWSGTRAVVGSLELSIQQIERNISEYSEAVRLVESGHIQNLDQNRTALGVIEGGDHE